MDETFGGCQMGGSAKEKLTLQWRTLMGDAESGALTSKKIVMEKVKLYGRSSKKRMHG